MQRQVSNTVKGHTVTGYPALVDEGTSVALRVFQTSSEQLEAMRGGVIRLLALRVPAPDRYVLEHLNNTEKLTFSQNPHGSVSALIADCALAAVDKLTPPELPWDRASFDALYEQVRAELIDTVFSVTAVVERILASTRRIEKQLKGTTSLALISALNDVRSQLEQLVFPGFVARTGYAQLSQLPRYLAAIEKRLERLPGNVQRDALNMAAVQRLEDDYDDAVSALLPGRRAGCGTDPGALDDRRAEGEPLRRRTRNRLLRLRKADPRRAEQGARTGLAPLAAQPGLAGRCSGTNSP